MPDIDSNLQAPLREPDTDTTDEFKSGLLARRFGFYSFYVGGFCAFGVTTTTIASMVALSDLQLWARIGVIAVANVLLVLLAVRVSMSIGRSIDEIIASQVELLAKWRPGQARSLLAPPMAAFAPNLSRNAGRIIASYERELARLRTVAYVDAQTGLASRTRLDEALTEVTQAARFENPAALILLELDGHGRLQDMLGAVRAAAVIQEVARRLKSAVRELASAGDFTTDDATLARTGAAEFMLLIRHGMNRERVAVLLQALRRAVREPLTMDGRVMTLAASAGVAMMPDDGETPDEIIRNAQLALGEVRATNQSGARFFTPRLNRLAKGRVRFEAELREAVRAREFIAVFQPKVCFQTGAIVGAEALARWSRPAGKLISPATFIPIAEEMGLIDQIGEMILEEACTQAALWAQDGHEVSVAVNVSPRQFERDDFIAMVVGKLAASGLQPSRLELEITESLAVSNPKRVAEIMRPLRAMGVSLAIDDFGSGHANLSILSQLTFDVFKIDRQFVSALQSDRQAPAIVEMILAMAETLNLKTVAEGVETPMQADFLRRRGCSMAQGFLYSPALSASDFGSLLNRWKPETAVVTWSGRRTA